MVRHGISRRVLVINADDAALDRLVRDITPVLKSAGHPVLRVLRDDAGDRAPVVRPLRGPLRGGAGVPPARGGTLIAGDLVVCADSRVAKRGGADLDLTRIEFDLLVELLRHHNQVVTKAMLSTVWHHEQVTPNAIEARISRLRSKLEREGPRVIHTVRAVGYVLHVPTPGANGETPCVLELVNDNDAVLDLVPHGEPWPAGGRV